jgi:two-component system CheB/CheR fusion protein
VARDTDLFNVLDKKHRILQRRDNGGAPVFGLRPFDAAAHTPPTQPHAALFDDGIDRSARRVIEPYSPVYFVIDRKHDIVRFSGADAGQYLEPSEAPPISISFRFCVEPCARRYGQQCWRRKPSGTASCRM